MLKRKKTKVEVEIAVSREEQKKIKELLKRVEEQTKEYPHVKVRLKIT